MINILFLWVAFNAFQSNPTPNGPYVSGPMVIVDSPVEASCLCGQVKPAFAREGLKGALIEEVTPDYEQVIQSTYSVENGYFKFPKASFKELHNICVSSGPEFQTICYKIKISKKIKETLIIKLGFR